MDRLFKYINVYGNIQFTETNTLDPCECTFYDCKCRWTSLAFISIDSFHSVLVKETTDLLGEMVEQINFPAYETSIK